MWVHLFAALMTSQLAGFYIAILSVFLTSHNPVNIKPPPIIRVALHL
jgi:hypothetical protein